MNNLKSTAGLLYLQQLNWVFWFTGIAAAIHVILIIVSGYFPEMETPSGSFASFGYQASKIFMLVAGLMSVYVFLEMLIEHGKTRKLFFQAAAAALSLTGITLTLLVFVVAGLEQIIRPATQASAVVNELELPLFSVSAVISFAITILFYYSIGMMISSGFYRWGWLTGLGFIAVGLVIILLESMIWGTEFFLFGITLSHTGVSVWTAVLLTAVLTLIVSWIAYMTIRKTPVKVR